MALSRSFALAYQPSSMFSSGLGLPSEFTYILIVQIKSPILAQVSPLVTFAKIAVAWATPRSLSNLSLESV
eukprot:11846480-Heterocapsa_arctica.AAC.1